LPALLSISLGPIFLLNWALFSLPVSYQFPTITSYDCAFVFPSVCREPRGFGFVQYVDPADAADAKYHMDGQILLGRELTVVFAEENRKKPTEMRSRERRC